VLSLHQSAAPERLVLRRALIARDLAILHLDSTDDIRRRDGARSVPARTSQAPR
jgi:hypothetical protein